MTGGVFRKSAMILKLSLYTCVTMCIWKQMKNHIFSLSFSFKEPGPQLLHIQVEDSNDAKLYHHFEPACKFIGKILGWI